MEPENLVANFKAFNGFQPILHSSKTFEEALITDKPTNKTRLKHNLGDGENNGMATTYLSMTKNAATIQG